MTRAVVGLMVLLSAAALRGSGQPLRVVDSVDLNQYAGRWFEIARFPNRFQKRCAGDVVVQYTLRQDARIDVVNRCRKADGEIERVHGMARKAGDGKNSAVLKVRFTPAFLSFLPRGWGDHLIIGLGPDYTWAVVGVPNRERLWILSRTPRLSVSAYEQAIEIARGNGFDVTRLVRTDHKN
jgi:apolipoprotein D and lipocalin family protein